MTLHVATLVSQLKEMDARELYYALDHNLRFNAISFVPKDETDVDKTFQEELQVFAEEYYSRRKEVDFFRIVENFVKNHKIMPIFAFNGSLYKVVAKTFGNAIYWAKTDSDEYCDLVSLLTGACWFAPDTDQCAPSCVLGFDLEDTVSGSKRCWYLPSEALSSYRRELVDAYLESLMPHELLDTTPALAHILHEFYTRRILLSSPFRIDSPSVYFTCYLKAKREIAQRVASTVESICEMPSYYPLVEGLDKKVLDIFGLKDRL